MTDQLQKLRHEYIGSWLQQFPLTAEYVDCATAVMLKILDGKCKMRQEEKVVMAALYQHVKTWKGVRLGDDIHQLIQLAGERPDDTMKDNIYEKRVLAETSISRPVMKQFKALIRQQGLFELTETDFTPQ